MKVIKSKEYLKKYKNKKLQKEHKSCIDRIIQILVNADHFQSLYTNNFAKLYAFERLKHELNWAFSFRVGKKQIRLIITPNTIEDYSQLENEKEVLVCDISYDHYEDIKYKKNK